MAFRPRHICLITAVLGLPQLYACSTFGSATGESSDAGTDGSNAPPGVLDGALRPVLTIGSRLIRVRHGSSVAVPFEVSPAELGAEVVLAPTVPGVDLSAVKVDGSGKGTINVTVARTTPTKTYSVNAIARVQGVESLAVRIDIEVEGFSGEIDDSFGQSGTSNDPGLAATAAIVAADDTIMIGGRDANGVFVRRLLADGKPDTAFGTNGTCRFPQPYGTGSSAFLDSLGRVDAKVLVGVHSESGAESAVFRIEKTCQSLKQIVRFAQSEQASVRSVGQRISPDTLVVTGETGTGLSTSASVLESSGKLDSAWGIAGRRSELAGPGLDYLVGQGQEVAVAGSSPTSQRNVIFWIYSTRGELVRGREAVEYTGQTYLGAAYVGSLLYYGLFDLRENSAQLVRYDTVNDKYDFYFPKAPSRARQTVLCSRCFLAKLDSFFTLAGVPRGTDGPGIAVTKLGLTGDPVATFGASGLAEIANLPAAVDANTPISLQQQQSGKLIAISTFTTGAQSGTSLARIWP